MLDRFFLFLEKIINELLIQKINSTEKDQIDKVQMLDNFIEEERIDFKKRLHNLKEAFALNNGNRPLNEIMLPLFQEGESMLKKRKSLGK